MKEVGARPEDELVFQAPRSGGHVNGRYLTGKLLLAMRDAGIARVGERGVTRDFHSLRHTYARMILESGLAQMEWVQRQLGHSSITITVDRYGHWAKEAERRQAEALSGVIPI